VDEQVLCSVAWREGDGFALHHLSPTSGTREREDTVAYAIPPELCLLDVPPAGCLEGTVAERLDAFQRERAEFESELIAAVGLGARIRAIARLFHAVWLLCGEHGSISDYVEVGVVDRKGVLLALPPTLCGTLLASDDATIEGLLEAPLPVSTDRLPGYDDWAAWFREGSVLVSPPDADARVVLRMVDKKLRWPAPGDHGRQGGVRTPAEALS